MRTIVLDFHDFNDKRSVHEFLSSHLDFPDYYGKNLDALYDVLSTVDRETTILVLPAGKEFETGFLSVFRDAAEENQHLVVGIKPS